MSTGLVSSIFTCNQLIHLYSNHGLLEEPHKLIDEIPHPNVFSWNAIIMACIKANNLPHAQALFDSASHRDLVSYNSMLSAYVGSHGYETEALDLFIRMQSASNTVGIDEFTLTTMVNLAAKLRVLLYGKQMHSYMVKTANDLSKFALSSLIDMYSKCGSFQDAYTAFRGCDGMVDLISKNAMGTPRTAMLNKSVKPDAVTFIALLSACRRSGLVELGDQFFISMEQDYNVLPEIYHYACMVDMYGRASKLEKAVEFMRKIPIPIDATIWAVIQHSSNRQKRLLKVEADNGSRYVQLANAYAATGKWDDMGRIRKKMRDTRLRSLLVVVGYLWKMFNSQVGIKAGFLILVFVAASGAWSPPLCRYPPSSSHCLRPLSSTVVSTTCATNAPTPSPTSIASAIFFSILKDLKRQAHYDLPLSRFVISAPSFPPFAVRGTMFPARFFSHNRPHQPISQLWQSLQFCRFQPLQASSPYQSVMIVPAVLSLSATTYSTSQRWQSLQFCRFQPLHASSPHQSVMASLQAPSLLDGNSVPGVCHCPPLSKPSYLKFYGAS
ncbi:hypothetical protein V8G54_012423 [Vigna mungo]|uniref:Pentatricopeptide repeat-containing protein n=1 Tax=Vigna mungo TaxID=3915 RepID=A0AAQ3NU72_VIGMU